MGNRFPWWPLCTKRLHPSVPRRSLDFRCLRPVAYESHFFMIKFQNAVQTWKFVNPTVKV